MAGNVSQPVFTQHRTLHIQSKVQLIANLGVLQHFVAVATDNEGH